MKKVILYGSPLCADCVPVKDYLTEKEIRFGYVDITSGMAHLKKFLAIRDSNPKYEEIKKQQTIGIPTLVIDDEPFLLPEGISSVDGLIKEFDLLNNK
ncbi:glutaredoxin domain-containing protein [Anaeropeptidivorans aminofermentans]|jgi:glutaredoxin-related protein|uniref:glutaredoxin domain-containing protein n=1 Tax=Anaeropeptidivorans aminofermentans TaxID=2934315 RepID=UPI002024D938|nr:glutaredoxin domain-containing protein [Anaeropeptidivorans aminofermentans]